MKGTLFVSVDNLGFISGQVRVRGKGKGEYPFHYLEMIDYVFGRERDLGPVNYQWHPKGTRRIAYIDMTVVPNNEVRCLNVFYKYGDGS
ncbi:MAG: hypothetical protein WA941_12285 [Nitrososphaeraceae archaeon]